MTALKFFRLEKGLTQTDLERRGRVKRWRLALAEGGHLTLLATETKRIAKTLGVSVDQLKGEK